MIVCIPDVLTPDEVKKVRAEAAAMPFVAGTETAGGRAKRVKNNEQVSQKHDERRILQEVVNGGLMRNKEFHRASLWRKIQPPLISRYREGMAYGKHVDNALMGPKTGRVRSDVSITVFISDIHEYDGGELVIHSPFGVQEVKLPSGSAVAYPSSTLHEVAEVTRGERLVAVTWAQSYVRDDHQRHLLANLAQVKDKMNALAPEEEETDLVHHTYANLLRMWAET